MNKSKEKSVDEMIDDLKFIDDFSLMESSWRTKIIINVINFMNNITNFLCIFKKSLKAVKGYVRKQKNVKNMTVEEFCKEMNCTIEYFEQICNDIKEITFYSDEKCIELAKANFFGDYMQDIDAETASKILQEVMEKYKLNKQEKEKKL